MIRAIHIGLGLLLLALVGCGGVELAAQDDAGAAGASAGAAGTSSAAAGTAGAAGAAGASGGASGSASSAGSSGAAGAADAGMEAAPPHPAVAACPSGTSLWGTRCPTPYPDGTICVLGCIANNAGATFDPPDGACFSAAPFMYQGTAVCLGQHATCAQCP